MQHNIPLKKYNTFGIAATAKHFVEICNTSDLKEALALKQYHSKFIISGGSNILITQDIEALVLYINIKGIEIVQQNEKHVHLKVMAGENWHELVLWTLENNFGGLENLSLIPGNTGTAPIQNIGAYGVELKDVFESCEAMDMTTLELKTFSREDCQFGYRDSYFKKEGKGKYIITSVTLKLTKGNHILQTSYGDINTELRNGNITQPGIRDISNAVVAIRRKKLPDPKQLGNSGSFFKNPVVSKTAFTDFLKAHPEAPYYKIDDDSYKIPAGWLIEQCGFKGKKYGDAGVHRNQALVLVNYGSASGAEILALAHKIQDAVLAKFNIEILPEVNII